MASEPTGPHMQDGTICLGFRSPSTPREGLRNFPRLPLPREIAREEKMMNRHSILVALSLLGTGLTVSSPAFGQAIMNLGTPNYPYDAVYNPRTFGMWPTTYGNPTYSYIYPPGTYSGNPFDFLGGIFSPVQSLAMAPVNAVSGAVSGATAPLVTGRSVATGQSGNNCSTPVRTCELIHSSFVGNSCSCRVHGGRARGSVVP